MNLSDILLRELSEDSTPSREAKDLNTFIESFSDPNVPKEIRDARQAVAMERLQAGAESLLFPRDYGPGDFVVWKSKTLKTHRFPGLGQPAYVLEVTETTPEYVERREENKNRSGSIYQALHLTVRVLIELEDGRFVEYWLPGDRLCRFFEGDLKRFIDENRSD